MLAFLLSLSLLGTSIHSLYNTLDPGSVSEHLAFAKLYPESEEGKKALAHAWKLLTENGAILDEDFTLPQIDINSIVSLAVKEPQNSDSLLSLEEIDLIDKISTHFANRKLPGHFATKKKEVLALPPEKIDLSRALLLHQFGEEQMHNIQSYEATLDFMALQIGARLNKESTDMEKVEAISQFIFHEMQFRFPPHALFAKDIDVYTLLPSVLDGRQGVCLGVSILYLCLAQRLDLPLEIVIPPGHIFVRYRKGDEIVNIETTARGIDMPSERYLSIETRYLPTANIKEVVGMAFYNQAAVCWGKQDYAGAYALYEKARPFMPKHETLDYMQGLAAILIGKKSEAKKYLKKYAGKPMPWSVSADTVAQDYFMGRVDAEGIKACFLSIDETRGSIEKKQKELEAILKKYPKFRSGLEELIVTHLQLTQLKKAQEALMRYHDLDPHNATIEYFLTVINMERYNYEAAWKHLNCALELTKKRDHNPRLLKELQKQLQVLSPI